MHSSNGSPTLPRRRLVLGLLAATAFLYWVAQYLYMPTLPLYAQSKSSNLQVIGIVLSMYGLGHIVIRLPVGIADGILGRHKPFIIAGLLLTATGAWVMGLAPGVGVLMVGQIITGLAAGTWVPLVLAFSDFFPAADAVRATGILSIVGSLARMTASSLTGSLNDRGGYPLAFFLAGGAAIAAILFVLPVREQGHRGVRPSWRSIIHMITRPDVLFPSAFAILVMHMDWTLTFGFLPILAKRLGGTNVTQSLLLVLYFALGMLGNFISTSLSKRIGSRNLIYLGFALLSLGGGLAALSGSLTMVFVAQACNGLGQGICYPVLMGMSVEHVEGAERATAMGLHQALYAVGMFSGPWLSGFLANALDIRPMFGITAATSLIIALFAIPRFTSGRNVGAPHSID